MAIEITIPRLGWSMEEGAFANWLKADGDTVSPGEPLFAVESDKVTMDVESLDAGILYIPPDAPEEGAKVVPGQLIGYLLAEGEAKPEGPLPAPLAEPPAAVPEAAQAPAPPPAATPVEKPAITPRARRVAAELGVATEGLQGSGRDGRIREQDVRAAAAAAAPKIAAVASGTRQAIAARMMESMAHTAPVTLTRRVDASRLTALRNRWKLKLAPEPAPSLTDIVAKVSAMALERHPALSGRWEDGRIAPADGMHISIAVDTEHGLLAPVVRNAEHLTLTELAAETRRLIQAARRREVSAAELKGGVFTVSNLGAFGVEAFTPILNFPQTAILGLGAIRWEPVVSATGQIVAREQMTLSLTFDHRVVDGAPAARFLQTLAEWIEDPPAEVFCA